MRNLIIVNLDALNNYISRKEKFKQLLDDGVSVIEAGNITGIKIVDVNITNFPA